MYLYTDGTSESISIVTGCKIRIVVLAVETYAQGFISTVISCISKCLYFTFQIQFAYPKKCINLVG